MRTALLCALLLAADAFSQTAKRPLAHSDYAAWKSIQAPTLSADGNFVAYALAPQEGDGEFVLLDLRTGKEHRSPRGGRPTVAVASRRKGKAAVGPSLHQFSPDGKFVLFPAYPAKGEKGKTQLTGSALCVMETATGKIHRVESVRGYQVPADGPPYAAFLRNVKSLPDPTKGETPKGETPKGKAKAAPAVTGELVLRHLATGDERSFAEVTEFSLARDGKTLLYAVNKKDGGGVYAVSPGQALPPVVLRSGPGRFSRLTWDEKQAQAAFFHTPPAPTDAKPPPGPPVIVHWKRSRTEAIPAPALGKVPVASLPVGTELAASKPAIAEGWRIKEEGGLAFSQDGGRVYFGLVPPPRPRPADKERVVVDLWHYRDDWIQPMQKAGYAEAQAKTYRAVFDLASRTCRQLADETMPEVSPGPLGDVAVGADDRPYRRLVGGSEQTAYADLSLIDIKTGARKALLKKQAGLAWSPSGKHLLRWDGKDWHCLSVATGKSANLTEKLEKVPFADETF
ncbi:MAG: hypothetical protein K2W96_25910, partial [Gemmataceae bacterium]|nr:hypothetical protein [Gemmataceae bacterium]